MQHTQTGPRTKNEFLALAQLLLSKISAPWLPPAPEALKIPDEPPEPTPFPDYTASEALAPLNEFREMERQLRDKRNDPESTKRSIKKLEHKLSAMLELAHSLMEGEKREKALHAAQREEYYRPYNEALAARKSATRKNASAIGRHREECRRIRAVHLKSEGARRKFIDRLLRDIDSTFGIGIPVQRIGWRVLPQGEWTLASILNNYSELQRRNPHVRYDLERIHAISRLKPSTCYIGDGEFDGYIVFTFEHTLKVVLECPIHGNAVYVMGGGWQALSRLSKFELLSRHNRLVTRIIHTGDWFQRLKSQL